MITNSDYLKLFTRISVSIIIGFIINFEAYYYYYPNIDSERLSYEFFIRKFFLADLPVILNFTLGFILVFLAFYFVKKIKEVQSRFEALKKLEKSKRLMDLGVLSQNEYDKILEKLKPILNRKRKTF